MKYGLLLVFIVVCTYSYGQKVTCIVIDKTTKQPVTGALISTGNAKTSTNNLGMFELSVPALRDSLKVVHFAYKTYTTGINKAADMVHIELESAVISLNTVTVHGDKDFKKDSIANRLAFAKQFNYRAPTIKDAFSDNPNKQPGELISVNPLLLIAALTKKSSPEYKFNKVLISDEHEQYVDEHFNRGIVSRITALKGDTLSGFLMRYRPGYQFVLKATEYDMEVYIKESFKKFEKDGFRSVVPLLDQADKTAEPAKLN